MVLYHLTEILVWEGPHLHQFTVYGQAYGRPDFVDGIYHSDAS
jgi:hypothetical protein